MEANDRRDSMLQPSSYAPYRDTCGPTTRTPVNVLGASHYEMRDGKVLREWRLFDEVAILAQVHAGRVAQQPSKG